MTTVSSDLQERFDYAALFYLSAWEYDPNGMIDDHTIRECTDEEARMIDLYERLSVTVGMIPPELMREAEELHATSQDVFVQVLESLIPCVGCDAFTPTSATEFMQKLNEFVRIKIADPTAFTSNSSRS
jgi:hypothetical protein